MFVIFVTDILDWS